MDLFKLISQIKPSYDEVLKEATIRQKKLLKPLGSLGALEDISIKFAGITGKVCNEIDKKVLFLFGADNGIYEEGVSGSPQSLTLTLMNHYAADKKCAINVICNHYNVDLKLVDMGIIGEVKGNCDIIKLMPNGTANFLVEPAMTESITIKAINIGFSYAKYAFDNGYNVIGNGEVGMGNTTTATACILASLGLKDCGDAVGRGGGLSDEAFEKKKQVITLALNKYNLSPDAPLTILTSVGGLDIAAMVGLYLGAAYYRLPIVIDGLISASAALIAYKINKYTKDYMFASHISEEPAYKLAVKELGLEPILALKMRLGEGSGCPFAFSIMEGAVAVMNNMATFEELAVDDEYRKKMKMK